MKISKSPGCTTNMNYYTFLRGTDRTYNPSEKKSKSSTPSIDTHMLYLVDLPGYGFAKRNRSEQRRWDKVVNGYLKRRDPIVLRRVFVLVDCRRGIEELDRNMMKILVKQNVPFQVLNQCSNNFRI